jgi:phenylacetate-CoA ligase
MEKMIERMDAYSRVYRRWLFPFYQRRQGRPTLALFERAQTIEKWPAEQIRDWQWQRAAELLRSAKENVPYYRERLRGVDVDSLRGWKDWESVPLLEKADVRAHRERFVSRKTRHALSDVRTSGSTGQPLVFYGSALTAAAGLSSMMRSRAWWGVDFCERNALIFEHGHKFKKNLKWKIAMLLRPLRFRLVNRVFLSAYRMSERDMDGFYLTLTRFRPRYLSGYATGLYMLAKHLRERGLDGRRIGATHVFYTSEMLYPWQKEMMGDVFGAKIAGEYGTVELGVLAHECPGGSFHTMDDLFYVEEIPLREDSSLAEIVVTTLFNEDTPLIRYRTGDVVHRRSSAQPCACGRGLHAIGRVEGRTHDLLVSPSGRVVHGQACTHIVNQAGRVRRFQVIQEDYGDVRVRIVRDAGFSSEQENTIRSGLTQALGEGVAVSFEYVDDIPAELSGKYRWVRSKVGALKREGVSASGTANMD